MYECHNAYSLNSALSQTSKADNAPLFEKPVCIQALKILDQIALRKRITRNVALTPGTDILRPDFTYKGIDNFSIGYVKLISNTDIDKSISLKKLDIEIGTNYNLIYSDGINNLIQPDVAIFDVTLHKIQYPHFSTKCFSKETHASKMYISRQNVPAIEVEAYGSSFGNVLCHCTGALIVDIGAFFIIRILQESEIAVLSYTTYEQEGI